MELTEGQVWVYRKREDSLYSKYLVIDYVKDGCFHCRETPIGKVTSFVCHGDDYLLDDECWELIDSEKICELLYNHREDIRIIYEDAAYERQLISARDFAEQEVKEKERICESVQAKLTQVANELDVERKKRAHVEKQNLELEEKLKDSISCAADKQEGILVFLKDGSERLIKRGVRHAFDSINDMFYVMDKEDKTIAGFESDFVRGFMPANMRQQRCD